MDNTTDYSPSHATCIECGRHTAYGTAHFVSQSWLHAPTILQQMSDSPIDILMVTGHYASLGPYGTGLITKIKEQLKLHEYHIEITHAVKCGNWSPENKEIKLCSQFLLNDIAKSNPRIVILYGAVALKAALNQSAITKKHGVIQEVGGIHYIPILDPGAIVDDQRKLRDFINDHIIVKQFLENKITGVPVTSTLEGRYTTIITEEAFDTFAAEVDAVNFIAFDTEYAPGDYLDPNLTCLMVSIATQPKSGAAIPIDHPESPWTPVQKAKIKTKIAEWLRTKKLLEHNAEADVMVGQQCFGVPIKDQEVIFCSMCGSMVIHGIEASNTLKNLANTHADTGGYEDEVNEWLRVNQNWVKGASFPPRFDEIPLEMLANPYAAGDADTTFQASLKLIREIEETKQEKYYYKVLLPSYKLNALMRINGLLVDHEELDWRKDYFLKEKENIYAHLLNTQDIKDFAESIEATGKKFSLKSSKQMQTLLFEVLGLTPSSRVTKLKSPSMDAKALSEMAITQDHPILNDLLHASKISTYLGTFINGLKEKMGEDGRLHARFHNFTESGRRGSSRPNAQNIPIGSGDPKDPYNIRMLIHARPGYTLISGDYGQLEFRTCACYCEDDNMLEACNSDDPHAIVQRRFGFERKLCKIINFLVLYEGGPDKLVAEVRDKAGVIWTLDEASIVIEDTKGLYPKLQPYIDRVHKYVEKNGYIRTFPTGQIRWMPHIYSPKINIRERAKREAWNHINQSVGHACLQYSLNLLQEYVDYNNKPWYINNDNHDGFLAEVPVEHLQEAIHTSHRFLTTKPTELLGDFLKVLLPVEMSTGTHWGNMKKIQTME